jgi:hypothetical protein
VIGGEHLAVRQAKQQPGVHRAEHRLPRLRAASQAGHVLQQPLDLGGGEVRVEHQAGALADQRRLAMFGELRAARRGAAVLPDNRPVNGPAGIALPHAHRLALIRDAQGCRHDARLPDRLSRGLDRDAEDLVGVVLHLAGGREMLRELAIAPAEQPPVGCDDERGRAGRALIDREDGGHAGSAMKGGWTNPRSVR